MESSSTNSIKSIKRLGFQWETQDPFLFCAYHLDKYPVGNGEMGPAGDLTGRNIGQDFEIRDGWRMYHGQKVPGFPVHPHRGFETITVVEEGLVDHADSTGAAGRYGNGDVQWMTAGKGVQHSEMFPLLNEDKDNPFLLFQIWLNLPKKSKYVEPYFGMFWSEDIPVVEVKDENSLVTKVKVIAGKFGDTNSREVAPDSWAADPSNEVAIWLISMAPNAKFDLPIASNEVNRSLFYYQGDQVSVGEQSIGSGNALTLHANDKMSIENGNKESRFLLLQGKPIGEPVVQYGPFVMNEEEEIRQTMREYQQTQFGGWPWPRPDQVHEKSVGRFAKHGDGSEEIK